MNKSIYFTLVFAFFACLVPSATMAGEFDGSKPLLCAAIFSTECGAESQECVSGAPWEINFPVFTEIDFKAKTVSTTRQHKVARVTEITSVSHHPNGHMSIQGHDGDYSWSMVVSEETGSMSLAVSGVDIGFLIFGACTIR